MKKDILSKNIFNRKINKVIISIQKINVKRLLLENKKKNQKIIIKDASKKSINNWLLIFNDIKRKK